MPKVLKLLERIDGVADGHTGRYLVYFSPDTHLADGTYDGGTLVTTEFPQHAQLFADAGAALECWKMPTTCACHAGRPDGKPNRPLTAYSALVEDIDDPLCRDSTIVTLTVL